MIHYNQYLAMDKAGQPITDEDGKFLFRDPRDAKVAISDYEATEENTIRISDTFIVYFKTWLSEDNPRQYLYEADVHDGNGVICIREKSTDLNALMASFMELVADPVRVAQRRAQEHSLAPNTLARIV